jgi:hypothetical protein
MAIEPDGKDFWVQFTKTNGGEWKGSGAFADPHSAKQHADHVLHSGDVVSVRVVQTRYYAWRNADGTFGWEDDIGEREDNDQPQP